MILGVKDISVKSFAEFMFVLVYTLKVLGTKSTKAYVKVAEDLKHLCFFL